MLSTELELIKSIIGNFVNQGPSLKRKDTSRPRVARVPILGPEQV